MDTVFLQDTQLRARFAACRYDAVSRYDVNLLNNGSYSQKEHSVELLGFYLLCCL